MTQNLRKQAYSKVLESNPEYKELNMLYAHPLFSFYPNPIELERRLNAYLQSYCNNEPYSMYTEYGNHLAAQGRGLVNALFQTWEDYGL